MEQNPSAEMKTQPGEVICFLSLALLLENHQNFNPRGLVLQQEELKPVFWLQAFFYPLEVKVLIWAFD